MSHETKALPLTELKFSDSGSGSFSGYASIFGNVDAYGDIVEKGAYAGTITDYLKHGFIAWSHDYTSLPIAIPVSAKEDKTGLWVEAQFHSDEFAQRARRIAAERAAAGKSVGLSIGYTATKFEHDDGGLRHLKAIDLYETSLVMLPANREAGIAGIKARPDPELKPYGIRQQGEQFCVYNTETGKTEKCHPTREAALRHQRALMANVEDADSDEADEKAAKAEWTAAYVNDLPDSAFAVILPGGDKDSDGKTTPRSLRKLPHHNADGAVDMPHLRNALSRAPQADLPEAVRGRAISHLRRHMGSERSDEGGKNCSHLFDFDVPFDELLVQLKGWLEYGAAEAEALRDRRAAEQRKLSEPHSLAIRDLLSTAEAVSGRLERLLSQSDGGKTGLKLAWELRRMRLRAMEND